MPGDLSKRVARRRAELGLSRRRWRRGPGWACGTWSTWSGTRPGQAVPRCAGSPPPADHPGHPAGRPGPGAAGLRPDGPIRAI